MLWFHNSDNYYVLHYKLYGVDWPWVSHYTTEHTWCIRVCDKGKIVCVCTMTVCRGSSGIDPLASVI